MNLVKAQSMSQGKRPYCQLAVGRSQEDSWKGLQRSSATKASSGISMARLVSIAYVKAETKAINRLPRPEREKAPEIGYTG